MKLETKKVASGIALLITGTVAGYGADSALESRIDEDCKFHMIVDEALNTYTCIDDQVLERTNDPSILEIKSPGDKVFFTGPLEAGDFSDEDGTTIEEFREQNPESTI